MSAYGAYGYALNGASHKAILAHYYTGIALIPVRRTRTVRVLLATTDRDILLSHATTLCGHDVAPSRTYRLRHLGATESVLSQQGTPLFNCRSRAVASGRTWVHVDGLGDYRGTLDVGPKQGRAAVDVVNEVEVNDYVRGVLPVELFPSWPQEALRAFAIAARSTGLATRVGGRAFDVYADTRTQVYRGMNRETPATDQATQATRDVVLTYGGQVVQGFYHSSSGGRTASGFLGAPRLPYLRSVDDPYDGYAPRHRWTLRFRQAEMDRRLRPFLKGTLRAVVVTKRGASPRIDEAVLVGSGGRTRVSGEVLRTALGLYDRWASFRRASTTR